MKPIDVIIVNYNAGMHLTNCVTSVLNSTIPVNIFISDNGSTDNSLKLLQQAVGHWPQVHIHKNEKNLGFSRGNNAVFDQTTADYLLYLNPDCIIKPTTLEQLLKEFDEVPQINVQAPPPADVPRFMRGIHRVGMVGCLIENPDGTEQAGCRRKIPTPGRTLIRMLRLTRFFKNQDFILTHQPLPQQSVAVEGISGAFMLVRRAAIEEVGLLDNQYFLHCEDLDWFMRFNLKNWEIRFVPHVAITHAKGVCSQRAPFRVLWHKHVGMMRFYVKFFRKRYNLVLMVIVSLGIGLRFLLLVVHQLIQGSYRQRRPCMHQLTNNVTDTHIS